VITVVKRAPALWFSWRSPQWSATLSVFAGVALWQLFYDGLARTVYFHAFAINHFFVSPWQVAQSFAELYQSGELVRNCYFSFLEFFYGFLLAIVVGVPFGFLMATRNKFNNFLDPWVSCIYATPRAALAPIVVVWFGLGIFPTSVVVFLGAVFPILLNTFTGIKSVRQNLIDVVRAFGGSAWQIFFKVMIPDATPAIIAGMRLAVGRAVIGVVVGELFGAEAGLGSMVYLYSQRFTPGPVFVGIVVLVIFGTATFFALEKLQRWVSPWYAFQLQRQVQGMDME